MICGCPIGHNMHTDVHNFEDWVSPVNRLPRAGSKFAPYRWFVNPWISSTYLNKSSRLCKWFLHSTPHCLAQELIIPSIYLPTPNSLLLEHPILLFANELKKPNLHKVFLTFLSLPTIHYLCRMLCYNDNVMDGFIYKLFHRSAMALSSMDLLFCVTVSASRMNYISLLFLSCFTSIKCISSYMYTRAL